MAKNKKRLQAKISKKQYIQQLQTNSVADQPTNKISTVSDAVAEKVAPLQTKTAALSSRMIFAFGLAVVATVSIYLMADRYHHYEAIGNWLYHGLRLDS